MGTENNHCTELPNADYNNKQSGANNINENNSQSISVETSTNFIENSGRILPQNIDLCNKSLNNDDITKIPIIIDENNVIDGAKEIIKVIRNDWNLNNVKFKFFTDGITNKLVGCFYNKSQLLSSTSSLSQSTILSTTSETSNKYNNTIESSHKITVNNENGSFDTSDNNIDIVLIRVYGNNTELLIDRKAEQRNIRLLHSYGFAPQLFATFKNGLAYEYVPGCTLTPLTVIQPKIWTLIAQRMADMHKVKLSIILNQNNIKFNKNEIEPMLWRKTQILLNLIPEKFSDKIKHDRVSKIFSSISALRKEFEELYKILEKLDSPLVFCHNDLLLGNVIYNENSNRVTFIDYEYAEINYQGFDIGNHFAEFTGIEVDEIDYKRYPSKEFQFEWLEVYLKSYLEITEVPKQNIEKLYIESNQFALAAHLFWAIWGLVQAENSKIDFDFVKYSQIRYEEYLNKKDEFLSLKMQNL
ncbi:ethanolamine kinase [Condylostylus longicornis]|uniref:ethanolamine kinase n=1 Tax=Condylostylus longicornis TaxID=2530218 RepID=UPI00244DE2ED|nr:ethanolamine kinase [Condylostylus longicornis]XP_055389829.1 ethanolamine kinase [Condylostylus longicornis]